MGLMQTLTLTLKTDDAAADIDHWCCSCCGY
jgi:hypothetical protein